MLTVDSGLCVQAFVFWLHPGHDSGSWFQASRARSWPQGVLGVSSCWNQPSALKVNREELEPPKSKLRVWEGL